MAIKREDKVGDEMKRILARVIQQEVKDPRVPPFTSVTEVRVTRDFSHATCYVSVLGTEEQKAECIKALFKARGFLRSSVAKQLLLRTTPELHFVLDDTYEKARELDSLIDRVVGKAATQAAESDDADSNDDDEDDGLDYDEFESDEFEADSDEEDDSDT